MCLSGLWCVRFCDQCSINLTWTFTSMISAIIHFCTFVLLLNSPIPRNSSHQSYRETGELIKHSKGEKYGFATRHPPSYGTNTCPGTIEIGGNEKVCLVLDFVRLLILLHFFCARVFIWGIPTLSSYKILARIKFFTFSGSNWVRE